MNITILCTPLPADDRLSNEVRSAMDDIYQDEMFITVYNSFPKNLLQLCSLACYINGHPVTGKSIRHYLNNRCEDIENTLSMPMETLVFLQEMRKCRSDVFNHAVSGFISLLDKYFPELENQEANSPDLVSFADLAIQETTRLIDRLNQSKP